MLSSRFLLLFFRFVLFYGTVCVFLYFIILSLRRLFVSLSPFLVFYYWDLLNVKKKESRHGFDWLLATVGLATVQRRRLRPNAILTSTVAVVDISMPVNFNQGKSTLLSLSLLSPHTLCVWVNSKKRPVHNCQKNKFCLCYQKGTDWNLDSTWQQVITLFFFFICHRIFNIYYAEGPSFLVWLSKSWISCEIKSNKNLIHFFFPIQK